MCLVEPIGIAIVSLVALVAYHVFSRANRYSYC